MSESEAHMEQLQVLQGLPAQLPAHPPADPPAHAGTFTLHPPPALLPSQGQLAEVYEQIRRERTQQLEIEAQLLTDAPAMPV